MREKNTFKSHLALLLSLILIITLIPVQAFEEEDGILLPDGDTYGGAAAPAAAVVNITTDTPLSDGDTISGTIGTDGGDITITVPSNATVTVTGLIIIQGTVKIEGGGTLLRGVTGDLFTVGRGASLTLENITIDGNNNLDPYKTNSGG